MLENVSSPSSAGKQRLCLTSVQFELGVSGGEECCRHRIDPAIVLPESATTDPLSMRVFDGRSRGKALEQPRSCWKCLEDLPLWLLSGLAISAGVLPS